MALVVVVGFVGFCLFVVFGGVERLVDEYFSCWYV